MIKIPSFIFPKRLLYALPLFLAVSGLAQITVTQPVPAKVTVDVDAAQVASYRIPRTIYGSFLEPIGNSTYNGLWAEILQNPSLEENLWDTEHIAAMVRDEPSLSRASQLGLPLPWEPLAATQGNRYEPRWGDAANSWRSLLVIGVPGHPTGIRQKVYLPVHRVLHYTGSLYAKHVSGPTQLTVGLCRRNTTEVLASAQVDATAGDWHKYEFSLTVPAGALGRLDPADFVVQVSGDESVLLDQLSLVPGDAVDGLDPDVVAMAKAMKTPLVRFGGNFTSGYHWRDGVGPADKRVSMLNIAWGIPEYNTFGTDEFLRFCELIGSEPQVALNLGSGSPPEAADWVRYINDRWSNKTGGLTWELGNELWGTWNLGWPTLDQLPPRTKAVSDAVRQIDPNACLIATGQDPDVYKVWNAAQLTNPGGTFDYLSTHFVVTVDQTRLPRPTPDFIAAATFALPIELGRKLREMQIQIDGNPAFSGKAHIAFTEWLYVGRPDRGPTFVNMGGAIGAAGFFNMLMRHADIVPVSDMTGILEFAGIWKKRSQVYAAPAYYAFRMYSNSDATRPVAVVTKSGEYSVQDGITRLPEIADVPYLDVVAALNDSGDTLTLFCVNRHLTRDLDTAIRLKGFTARGDAEIQTLRADSIYERNDETDPENVIPQAGSARVSDGALAHAFPHESITVITLHKH
jgi:alpha-L-arabinofuranosidase